MKSIFSQSEERSQHRQHSAHLSFVIRHLSLKKGKDLRLSLFLP
jgi:hypothetical protein